MAQIIATTSKTQSASNSINAVCVDVVDLGTVETPWGQKPQVKLAFETDQLDPFGQQRILVRTFNRYTHPQSALSIFVKNWCNRDLALEEETGTLDLNTLVGDQARLVIQPTPTRNGGTFDKIAEALPAGEIHVQPSGKYQRED